MLPNPNTITEQLDAIERMTKTGLIFVTPSGVDLLYSLEENPEAFSKEQLQKTSHILGLINADIIGRIARLSAAVEDANALQAWRDLREQGRKKKEEERLRKDQEIALLRQKEHLCALRAREHVSRKMPSNLINVSLRVSPVGRPGLSGPATHQTLHRRERWPCPTLREFCQTYRELRAKPSQEDNRRGNYGGEPRVNSSGKITKNGSDAEGGD